MHGYKKLLDERIQNVVKDIMGSGKGRQEYCERLVRGLIAESIEAVKPAIRDIPYVDPDAEINDETLFPVLKVAVHRGMNQVITEIDANPQDVIKMRDVYLMTEQILKLTNKFTGEIIEFAYNPQDVIKMRDVYLELQRWETELSKIKQIIAADVMALMGDEREAVVGNYAFKIMSRSNKTYEFTTVRRYIDEDRLITFRDEKGTPVIKVQSGALKKLMSEMTANNELPDGAASAIEESAEFKASKPFIKLERLV